MDRLTRKELKRDAFAQEVSHTVEYLSEHKKQFLRYGSVVLVLAILGVGYYYYGKRQHTARQRELTAAMRIQDAPVGPSSGSETALIFATREEKNKAAVKVFSELAEKHPGTEEGAVARYYLGTIAADEGRMDEAAKSLKEVADSEYADYASLAKLALAEIYHAQGRTAEGEKLLRSLIDKPTILVSKVQATVALARILADSKPEEARKLLEPLRTEPGATSRVALSVLAELPKK